MKNTNLGKEVFSQQDSASLKCLHTHCNRCWKLISTNATYITIDTVTSKRSFCIRNINAFLIIHVTVREASCTLSVRINVISNTMLHVPITEVTFSLNTSTLTLILRFEYIVNTLCIATLCTLQLYILQHFATPLYIL